MADQRLEKYNWLGMIFEAFSLSGAIILILAFFTGYGIWMDQHGIASGSKVWATFGAAFMSFITGKGLGESDALKSITTKSADDDPKAI